MGGAIGQQILAVLKQAVKNRAHGGLGRGEIKLDFRALGQPEWIARLRRIDLKIAERVIPGHTASFVSRLEIFALAAGLVHHPIRSFFFPGKAHLKRRPTRGSHGYLVRLAQRLE